MRVLHVVGTRPNFMKVAPVLRAFDGADAEQVLVHTGQHYDANLSDVFFADLHLPQPDHFLGVGSGSHAQQTAQILVAMEEVLLQERPDVVLVPGDVNSTLAAALAAVKLHLPVAHLEAGLRSRDRGMPEEHNRIVVDHISDLLLTTSADADDNLRAEGIPTERMRCVGNTMIDSLRRYEDRARELDVARALGISDHILVTLHRPSLVDRPAELVATIDVLEDVARDRPVVFPVHPRTRKRLAETGVALGRVMLVEPQGYLRFLSLMASAAAVLTDSGGVQEETTVLGTPCFTLRTTTERPITVSEGTNTLLGTGPNALETFRDALDALPERRPRILEGWDGAAGPRARAALEEFVAGQAESTAGVDV